MQVKRKPTALTWVCLLSLSIAAVVIAFRVLPDRSDILAQPSDAISIIVVQTIASLPLLVVALVARSIRSVFFSAGALHCVIATSSILVVPILWPYRFAMGPAIFEISMLTPFEPVVHSLWFAILCLALAEIPAATAHGLAGWWLASTCQRKVSEGSPREGEHPDTRLAARIQCVQLLAGIVAIPCFLEVAGRRENTAVDNLKAVGARMIFVPSNRFIDLLFGTQCRVLLSGQQINDQVLANLPRLRRLDRLTLERCAITDDGLKPLAGLNDMRILWILGCPITDRGLAHLEPLRSISLAGFFGDKLSAAGVEQLVKAWRHGWIVYDQRARPS